MFGFLCLLIYTVFDLFEKELYIPGEFVLKSLLNSSENRVPRTLLLLDVILKKGRRLVYNDSPTYFSGVPIANRVLMNTPSSYYLREDFENTYTQKFLFDYYYCYSYLIIFSLFF